MPQVRASLRGIAAFASVSACSVLMGAGASWSVMSMDLLACVHLGRGGLCEMRLRGRHRCFLGVEPRQVGDLHHLYASASRKADNGRPWASRVQGVRPARPGHEALLCSALESRKETVRAERIEDDGTLVSDEHLLDPNVPDQIGVRLKPPTGRR